MPKEVDGESQEYVPLKRTRLKRDLEREALIRLEEAARTGDEFDNVITIWNRLDSNRERKERYHEVGRSSVPLEWEAAADGVVIPRPVSSVYWRQIMKGDFIEAIYDCPFEIQEVVEHSGIADAILQLKDDHKEVLYYLFIRQYSCQKVAGIRGQTDRNIRKIRDTILKKIRKQLLSDLQIKRKSGHSFTLEEKIFLQNNHPEAYQ